MSQESRVPVILRRTRRAHHKSRSGCTNCKRRKVKCDDVRPVCSSCIRFHLQCSLSSDSASSTPPAGTDLPLPPRKRGSGRPRNNWNEDISQTSSFTPSPPTATPTPGPSTPACSLNVPDIELLLYYCSRTAPSFVQAPQTDGNMATFWTQDILRLGLSDHYILHLCFALAGYHLAQSDDHPSSKSIETVILAHSHYQKGVAEFSSALSEPESTDAGTLFVAALLVCFGRFAAGPVGPGDLAVCDLDGSSCSWLPLIRGARLIRETTSADSIFKNQTPAETKKFHPEHLHIEWEKPLQDLRSFIASSDIQPASAYLHSLDELILIYEATYGRKDGSCSVPPHNRFVLGWLYRMDNEFVTCLDRKEPLALLLLAYYSLLFKTMGEFWVMKGWCEHLLREISKILCSDLSSWLQWPKEQAGLAD